MHKALLLRAATTNPQEAFCHLLALGVLGDPPEAAGGGCGAAGLTAQQHHKLITLNLLDTPAAHAPAVLQHNRLLCMTPHTAAFHEHRHTLSDPGTTGTSHGQRLCAEQMPQAPYYA